MLSISSCIVQSGLNSFSSSPVFVYTWGVVVMRAHAQDMNAHCNEIWDLTPKLDSYEGIANAFGYHLAACLLMSYVMGAAAA